MKHWQRLAIARISTLLTLLLLLSTPGHAGLSDQSESEPDLKLYYIQYVPWIMPGGNGPPGGTAAPKLIKLLDRSGLTYKFYYVPWLRAIKLAQSEDNSLIFPLTRSAAREEEFQWIFRMFTASTVLLANSNAPYDEITPEMAASGNYRAVCNMKTAGCGMLAEYGFPDDNILQLELTRPFETLRVIATGRADIVAGDMDFARAAEMALPGPNVSFKQVSPTIESRDDYLASGFRLRPEYRKALEDAATALHQANTGQASQDSSL